MNEFANYKNGEITIDTYRMPDATATDIADILSAKAENSAEILTATIYTDEDRDMVAAEAASND